MPRPKRIGFTGEALEKKLKLFPAGEERERMRKLLSPLPTGSELQRKAIAELKKRTTQPRRQAVLDDTKAGMTFGDIGAKHGLTVLEVCHVHLMNQKRHVWYTTNEVSV